MHGGVGVLLLNSTARGFSFIYQVRSWCAAGPTWWSRTTATSAGSPRWSSRPSVNTTPRWTIKKRSTLDGYSKAPLPSLIDHRPIQEESCDLKFGSWVYNAGQLDLRPVDWKSLDTFMFFFCPLLLICPDTEHWHDGPGGLHWQHPVGPLGNPRVQVSYKNINVTLACLVFVLHVCLFGKTVCWRLLFSGGKRCTTAASTPLLTSHTPSGREYKFRWCFFFTGLPLKVLSVRIS